MKTYTTVQGDMWDSIALSQLGDVKYTDLLIKANTEYIDVLIFSAGVKLNIPEIKIQSNLASLPPWKQVNS